MSTHTARRNSGSSMASMLTGSSADSSVSSCSSPDAAGPSSHRLTLADIHIPAGFEIAKDLGQNGKGYPAEECILKAADVLKSLRGRMPDGSDGQVAACDYCRRRKIRCDRTKPTCGSCAQTDRKCTTEDMLRKRGPPSKKERALLEAAGIIFRGTRPHRRRRTATTSLGSGAAASKQQEMLKKAIKDSASISNKRVRSHSTNSTTTAKPNAAAASALAEYAQRDGESKSSWMEMLSLASQTSNPFAESPVSSPSDLSPNDTVQLDAGACDYMLPMSQFGTMTPHEEEDDAMRNAHWDSMWTTFKQTQLPKHALPPMTAFVPPQDLFTKVAPPPSNPYASLEAGALDWSNSHFSLQQYQSFYPLAAQPDALQQTHAAQQQQRSHNHSLFGGNSNGSNNNSNNVYAPEDAAAFHSAMSHFFPTPAATSEPTPQGQYTSDSSSPATLSPMDNTPHNNNNNNNVVVSPQPLFSIDALSAF